MGRRAHFKFIWEAFLFHQEPTLLSENQLKTLDVEFKTLLAFEDFVDCLFLYFKALDTSTFGAESFVVSFGLEVTLSRARKLLVTWRLVVVGFEEGGGKVLLVDGQVCRRSGRSRCRRGLFCSRQCRSGRVSCIRASREVLSLRRVK